MLSNISSNMSFMSDDGGNYARAPQSTFAMKAKNHFEGAEKNYWMRGSETFCHLSHIGGRLVKFNPKKKNNVIVNDI